MASTSTSTALIHHFRSRRCCFKHLEPVRTQLNSVKINSSWKGAGLRFIASRNGNGFNRAVCFAAFDDDLRDKPPELGNTSRSGGASSALEDRPGMCKRTSMQREKEFKVHLFFTCLWHILCKCFMYMCVFGN